MNTRSIEGTLEVYRGGSLVGGGGGGGEEGVQFSLSLNHSEQPFGDTYMHASC